MRRAAQSINLRSVRLFTISSIYEYAPQNPRGIRGYSLSGNTFDTWKLIGNFGGEDYPDKVRGPYNEGGLWAERVGE